MDDDFIRIGSISLQSGSMPHNDDEAAIEWDTLLKLNQGTQIGQEIHISVQKGSNQTTENIEKHTSLREFLITIRTSGVVEIIYRVLLLHKVKERILTA